MPSSNVEVHQIGSQHLAVVFNKHALQEMRNGGATGCQLSMGKKRLKLVFMRDTDFHKRKSEFQKNQLAHEQPKLSIWQRVKGWFKWQKG